MTTRTPKSPPLPRICVTATGEAPGELLGCARRALAQNRFVELRLDWLPNPSDGLPLIATLLAQSRAPVLQATCRRRENGGRFAGTVSQQLEILRKAAAAGCAAMDLEIESAEAAGKEAVAELRERARLILSFHDFQSTPSLSRVARRLRRFPADYYKVITTATRQTDNCDVLEFLEKTEDSERGAEKWIAFCMGEAGVPSRVLALSRGSAFVYAAPAPSASSRGDAESTLAAPGQLDYEMLRKRYRAEQITHDTAIYGLLGNPVRHSVGAAIHNAAFRARGLDAVYLPLLSSDLNDFQKAAARYPLAGFSVTIPHKEGILRFVERADKWVKAAGAANTVRIVREGRDRWEATNTDIGGIVAPLRKAYRLSEREHLPAVFRVVIVGNGGAARAAAIALRSLRCRNVWITGRNPGKIRRFARALGVNALPMEKVGEERFDLLVHATSVGMWPHEEECLLRPEQIAAETVFDLIYNPSQTRLLRLARERGCRVISGLEMFLAQAARQFEYWTGLEAPARLMRRVAVGELGKLVTNDK